MRSLLRRLPQIIRHMATTQQATLACIGLPDVLRPRHYNISLFNFNFTKFTYSGSVDIECDVIKPSSDIYLNSLELDLKKATISSSGSKTEQLAKSTDFTYDKTQQIVKIKFTEHINGPNVILSLHFDGVLNNKMAGFYRSEYQSPEGEKRFMYSTQFEATDAARCFPCFDEPALKATFDCSLVVPIEFTALSNMPVKSETPVEGDLAELIQTKLKTEITPEVSKNIVPGKNKLIVFEQTPIMSTYLLAFVMGDLEYIEAPTKRVKYHGQNIPVRIYTTRGLIKQGQFALENAVQIVDYFSEVFDIDYPLPKLDLVAVHEFSHGAMENWGLVTYRTTALLFDEGKSDEKYKQRVAYVVAHELAHQWFGNLVTMKWWDNLWLNESFATWVGWLAVDKFHPTWDVWSRFTSDALQSALHLDSLRTSHPIEVEVGNALDINQIFDHISYLKGASCIRMLSDYLGVNVFNRGVSRYLKKFKYGNAQTADLWAGIAEESGKDVAGIMNDWVKEMGFPVLTVAEEMDGISIRQNRFISSGDLKEEEDKLWWVPLGLLTNTKNADVPGVLTEKQITIRGIDTGFYKLNTGQSGVYRVNYPPERLQILGQQARDSRLLTSSDKIGLVADAGALATSGLATTTGLLAFVEGLSQEPDFVVWEEIAKRLSNVRSVWYERPQDERDLLKSFVRKLTSQKANELGWEFSPREDYLTMQLRSLVVSIAGRAGNESIVKEAKQRFEKYIAGDESAINPSIRRGAFAIVLSQDDASVESSYDAVLKIYRTTASADGKETALSSLGDVSRSELIDKAIAFLFSGEIPSQDVHTLGASLAANSAARNQLWNAIVANWDTIYERYSANMTVLNRFLQVTLSRYSSFDKHSEISAYFKDINTDGFNRGLAQSLDTIAAAAKWVERDNAIVKEYLSERGY